MKFKSLLRKLDPAMYMDGMVVTVVDGNRILKETIGTALITAMKAKSNFRVIGISQVHSRVGKMDIHKLAVELEKPHIEAPAGRKE